VSINAGTVEQLDTLEGIGPATAQKIVDDRAANGPYASVEELARVPGIGEATIAALRDHVTL
jgi:competence protein ComEA